MSNLSYIEDLKKTREELINEVKKELLGPGSEFNLPDMDNEIITDKPESRYSIGILFPQNSQYKVDNDDSSRVEEEVSSNTEEYDITENINEEDLEADNISTQTFKPTLNASEENNLDEEIALASQNLPSSMGYTYFIKGQAETVNCEVSFGMYRKTKLADCMVPFILGSDDYILPIEVQKFVEFDSDNSTLKLISPIKRYDVYKLFKENNINDPYLEDRMFLLSNQIGPLGYKRMPYKKSVIIQFDEDSNIKEKVIDGFPIKIVCMKKALNDEISSITIMMVNTNYGFYKGTNSIFQPKLRVTATLSGGFSFVDYSNTFNPEGLDEEEKSLELLYRNKKSFGTGHGTSVIFDIDKEGYGFIENEFFPIEEIPQIDFEANKKVSKQGLSMKYLSDLNDIKFNEKIEAMNTLLNSYKDWINEIDKSSDNPKIVGDHYKSKAKEHIENCKRSFERMQKGLKILQTNSLAKTAFLLANRAMFMQRIHLELQAKDKYPGDENLQSILLSLNYYERADEYFWRPFQLAFLLMSVESIVDDKCMDRDIVDLIWFPTGGGKTEAYLGLTAFAIFYRRLTSENAGGTAVVMRYTLRLLAAQQFVRAATLICACEVIRKHKNEKEKVKYPVYDLGKEAITIGLWIGSEHTPNRNQGKHSAQEYFNKLTDSNKGSLDFRKDNYNKFQILKCPWCGTKLVKDFGLDKKGEIGDWGYRLKNGKTFRMSCTQENCNFELDLPIQIVDEELYKNPPTLLFGTVDKFAMLPWKKEVGSFFAIDSKNRAPELIIQDELHLISGPLGTMVGLYETAIDALCSNKGVKPKIIASTATIRRAKEQCSVLFNREVNQFPSPGIDANDSYFAKEADTSEKHGRVYVGLMPSGKTKAMMEVRSIAAILEKTNMLKVSDEIKDKFWTLAIYFNSLRDLGKCRTLIDDDVKDFIKRSAYRLGNGKGRSIGQVSELTSRVSTFELNRILEQIETLEYSKENIKNNKFAVNTLLATNMISVGVDVARLNIMLLVGQPKLTSEYIQASSRIGRQYPGVAFVLYDGTKSRDRSHYEQFRSYHESFYKFVEPTGATPFSDQARERALHAVIISLMRHIYGLSQDQDAAQFKEDKFIQQIKEVVEYITERANCINKRSVFQLNDETEKISEEILDFFKYWSSKAQLSLNNRLYYGEKFMFNLPSVDDKRLMKVFGSTDTDTAIETLTSMRNVDTSCKSSILIWED